VLCTAGAPVKHTGLPSPPAVLKLKCYWSAVLSAALSAVICYAVVLTLSCVQVYDTNMHQFVGSIKRPKGGRFADCFDCQLYVHDGDTAEVLYVAWPDCIKVGGGGSWGTRQYWPSGFKANISIRPSQYIISRAAELHDLSCAGSGAAGSA